MLILSSHNNISLFNVIIFLSGFLPHFTRTAHLPTHVCYMTSQSKFRLLFVTILGEEYKLWSSSLCNFLQPPDTWLSQYSEYATRWTTGVWIPGIDNRSGRKANHSPRFNAEV